MRDGSLIGISKGNKEWNWSAPHGSGRISSHNNAGQSHTLPEFKEAMEGIYSTCVSKDTLDEAPSAYWPQIDLLDALCETVEAKDVLKPVYNFKAGSRK